MPPTLSFGIALTAGLLAGLAIHTALINLGWGLGGFLHDSAGMPPAATRSAAAWWLIAATAFLIGGATGMLALRAGRMPLLIAAGALVATALLAYAGHSARIAPGPSPGLSLSLHLSAGALAGLMAFAGAFISLRPRD